MVRMTNARRPRIRPRSSLTPTAPIPPAVRRTAGRTATASPSATGALAARRRLGGHGVDLRSAARVAIVAWRLGRRSVIARRHLRPLRSG